MITMSKKAMFRLTFLCFFFLSGCQKTPSISEKNSLPLLIEKNPISTFTVSKDFSESPKDTEEDTPKNTQEETITLTSGPPFIEDKPIAAASSKEPLDPFERLHQDIQKNQKKSDIKKPLPFNPFSDGIEEESKDTQEEEKFQTYRLPQKKPLQEEEEEKEQPSFLVALLNSPIMYLLVPNVLNIQAAPSYVWDTLKFYYKRFYSNRRIAFSTTTPTTINETGIDDFIKKMTDTTNQTALKNWIKSLRYPSGITPLYIASKNSFLLHAFIHTLSKLISKDLHSFITLDPLHIQTDLYGSYHPLKTSKILQYIEKNTTSPKPLTFNKVIVFDKINAIVETNNQKNLDIFKTFMTNTYQEGFFKDLTYSYHGPIDLSQMLFIMAAETINTTLFPSENFTLIDLNSKQENKTELFKNFLEDIATLIIDLDPNQKATQKNVTACFTQHYNEKNPTACCSLQEDSISRNDKINVLKKYIEEEILNGRKDPLTLIKSSLMIPAFEDYAKQEHLTFPFPQQPAP